MNEIEQLKDIVGICSDGSAVIDVDYDGAGKIVIKISKGFVNITQLVNRIKLEGLGTPHVFFNDVLYITVPSYL